MNNPFIKDEYEIVPDPAELIPYVPDVDDYHTILLEFNKIHRGGFYKAKKMEGIIDLLNKEENERTRS